jgi:hypothetical protein
MKAIQWAMMGLCPFVVSMIQAASLSEVMFSRYLKYQVCMERQHKPGPEGHGDGVYKRLGLQTVMNRWGTSEATARSVVRAPLQVRQSDARCRVENEIQDQPRPD